MTSAHQKLLLRGLGYDKADTLNTLDNHSYRSLVAWLEHTKVQQLPDTWFSQLNIFPQSQPIALLDDRSGAINQQSVVRCQICPLRNGRLLLYR